MTQCICAAVYEHDGQQMTSEAITVHPPFQFGATLSIPLARGALLISNHQYPLQGRFQIRFFAPQNLAIASGVQETGLPSHSLLLTPISHYISTYVHVCC